MRPDMGRASLGFLDSRLNKQIVRGMHTYGEDCALTFARFWDDIDHYYLVHCLDYFALAILFRDPYICHFWSIYYEIIELSAKHRLPHFEECWWDSLLTDIAFSNTPAIILGMFFLDKLGVRRYDWLGRFGKQSVWDWEVFKCHRRFAGNCLPLVLFSFHFLSSFFLMNALLVPPTHPAVACRMLLWAVIGGLGFQETYADIETWGTIRRKTQAVEGRYRWLAAGLIFTELLIAYKYREGTGHITDTPTPWYIWMPWSLVVLALIGGFFYLRFKPGHTVKYPGFGQPEEKKVESPRGQKRVGSPTRRSLSPKKQV